MQHYYRHKVLLFHKCKIIPSNSKVCIKYKSRKTENNFKKCFCILFAFCNGKTQPLNRDDSLKLWLILSSVLSYHKGLTEGLKSDTLLLWNSIAKLSTTSAAQVWAAFWYFLCGSYNHFQHLVCPSVLLKLIGTRSCISHVIRHIFAKQSGL